MIEHANLTFTTFETWMGISAAVLLVAHLVGSNLSKKLRVIIVCAYLAQSTTNIISCTQSVNAMIIYNKEIQNIGGLPYPNIGGAGIFSGLLIYAIFAIGLASVIVYFLKATRAKSN